MGAGPRRRSAVKISSAVRVSRRIGRLPHLYVALRFFEQAVKKHRNVIPRVSLVNVCISYDLRPFWRDVDRRRSRPLSTVKSTRNLKMLKVNFVGSSFRAYSHNVTTCGLVFVMSERQKYRQNFERIDDREQSREGASKERKHRHEACRPEVRSNIEQFTRPEMAARLPRRASRYVRSTLRLPQPRRSAA